MTRSTSAREADGLRRRRTPSARLPDAPTSCWWPRPTTIGRARCMPGAFCPSRRKPDPVSRDRGRAPTIGTKTSARREAANSEQEGRRSRAERGSLPHARPACQGRLRPRSAALDPPDRRRGRPRVFATPTREGQPMPVFTIETTYRLPVYRHQIYEAATMEEACRFAVDDDDWSTE